MVQYFAKCLLLCSGEVLSVEGISKSLSVGQVVWAPATKGYHQYLVFVGWSAEKRKLGIKYCYNRRCALYAVRAPFHEMGTAEPQLKWVSCSEELLILSAISLCVPTHFMFDTENVNFVY